MRTTIALVLIILWPASPAAQVNRARQSSPLVFNHVTVLDMKGGRPEPDMTVVIQGNRIVTVGKSAKTYIPKNARVVNATGTFLIPGLWNMHVHLGDEDFDKHSHLRLYVANGVTGIRLMDGDPAYQSWRKEAEGGTLLAPRMVIASRVIGSGDLSNLSEAKTRDQVRRAKREGADFIKVHDNVLRESYFALIDEARRVGLPVEGHVPPSITAADASRAGQKSIEHFTGLDEAKFDDEKAESLIAVLRNNRTWLCPTIIMRSNYASLDDSGFAEDTRLNYVKPSWKGRWSNMTKEAGKTPAAEWAKSKELIRT